MNTGRHGPKPTLTDGRPERHRREAVGVSLLLPVFGLGLLAVLAFTPASASEASDPVRLEAKLLPRRSRKPLTVGDRFEVELSVRRHRDRQVSAPVLDDDRFLVLDAGSVTRYEGDTIVDVHTLELAAFATGELHLPGFRVAFPEGDEVRQARSDSLPLGIASVMPEAMEDIADLKPQVPFPNLLPLWLVLGALAAAVLGYAGWRLLRRWRRARLTDTPLPEPWDEALAALAALPVKDWLASGQVKRYYYAVSEILKRYLTRRYGFPAIDQTTSEMVYAMKAARISEREEFVRFFRRADFVKYAKLVPERPELEAAVTTARELVERTREQESPEGPGSPVTRSLFGYLFL